MAKQQSRTNRWIGAAQEALAAIERLKETYEAEKDNVVSALESLREVQEEYEEWRDNLPDSLQDTACGEKLEGVCELDIEGAVDTLTEDPEFDECVDMLNEAEGIELPLGFGRD